MRFLLPLAAVVPIALACGVTDHTEAPPVDLITEANPAGVGGTRGAGTTEDHMSVVAGLQERS